jgi:transcriptional regulator with XRE-family HTH domain
MKTINNLKVQLVLTQEEVALYLVVTRSQYSMYCIGKLNT